MYLIPRDLIPRNRLIISNMQNILLVILLFALTSCGGGGGGGSTTSTGTITSSYSGVAIDGNLYRATAFLDLNGNGTYDSGEPTATTDSSGAFTLTATADQISSYSVVVSAIAGTTIDQDTPNTPITSSMTLMAPAGSPSVISPLTTQVSAKMAAGMTLGAAKTAVQTELGLTGVDVTKNYVAEKATNSAYADAHKVAASIAEVLKNIDQQSSANTTLASKLSSLSSNVTSTVAPIASQIKSSANLDDARTAVNTQISAAVNIYNIGGSISGLTANGLVLANGTNTVSPSSGANTFTFSTKKATGAAYAVTVQANPSGQTCTVSNASGNVATTSVSNISVVCVSNPGALGGTVSGLSTSGLVLKNGTDELTVNSGASTFQFGSTVSSGATYSVTVKTQPTGKTCSVSNSTGTMTSAGVTTVQVTCSTNSYTLGGSISGLSTSGLKLKSGSETLTISSGATAFTFNTQVSYGGGYSVTVDTQPTGYTCSLSNSSGTMGAANVTAVQVTCAANSYTLGGSISGLAVSGLKIKNGSEILTITSGATSFLFANSVAYGGTYSVSIDTQPTGYTCTASNSSGTMGSSNISAVQINCAINTYTVTANVTGLQTGQSLTLYYNNNIGGGSSSSTTINANGSTTIATAVPWNTYASTAMATSPANGQVCYATFDGVNKSFNGDSNSQVSSQITGNTVINVVCSGGYQVYLRNVIVPIPVQTGGIPILQTQYITNLEITFTATVNGSTTTQVIPRSSISPTMAPQYLSVPFYMNYSLGIFQSGATYTFTTNKPSCQNRINDAVVNPTISGSNSTLSGTITQIINFDLVCPSAGI